MKGKSAATVAVLPAAALVLAGCGSQVAGQAVPGAQIPAAAPAAPVTTSVPAQASTVTPTHHVNYTLTADKDTPVTILYLTTEPSNQAEFKKAPAHYLSMTTTTVGPSSAWTFGYSLNDPDDWRYLHASINGEVRAELHCLVSVDDVGTDNRTGNNSVECPERGW